ncbi:flavoprotein [Kitasatospora sp. NBC_01539]|uniref:flavoprotein n=1 Tax=Kitasatospora sp. NBC_01539 TaxID=2903577 RepID=UPI0038603122
MPKRVLYLLGSAAAPVLDAAGAVRLGQASGWDVVLGLTPTAADWLADDLAGLEELTGHPVKSRYRRPGDPDVLPPADAVLFAPATLNSVNSLALGITTSWVVGYAAEAVGKGIPVSVMPCTNTALTAHPQFGRSVDTLRGAGVRVLLGPGLYVPAAPGEGDPATYPWAAALGSLGPPQRPRGEDLIHK